MNKVETGDPRESQRARREGGREGRREDVEKRKTVIFNEVRVEHIKDGFRILVGKEVP